MWLCGASGLVKQAWCLMRARALAKSRNASMPPFCPTHSKAMKLTNSKTIPTTHTHTRYRHKLQLSSLIMFASSSSATAAAFLRAGRPTGALGLLARPVLSQTQRRNISVGAKIPDVQLKEVRALASLGLNFAHAWVAACRARLERRGSGADSDKEAVLGDGAASKYKEGGQAQSQAQDNSPSF